MSATNRVVEMVNKIIRDYNVPVTRTQANEYLLTHPDFPDLLSISDAFDEWNIDHATLKLKKDQLIDVETPFIATLKDVDDPLIVINEIDNDFIYYQTNQKETVKVSLDEFAELWNGVVIAISPDEDSGEKDYTRNIKKERVDALKNVSIYSFFALFLFIALRYVLNRAEQTMFPVLPIQLVLSAVGVALSASLYAYDKNAAPDFVKNICKAGTNFNCSSVLQSNASKLFGVISWAEVGLIYFSGFFISLLWPNSTMPSTLAWVNLIALPYTIFSIYYQAFVSKKWCVICTAIQVLLWLQFTSFYFSNLLYARSVDGLTISQLLFSFGLSAIALLFTGKLLLNTAKVATLKKEVNRYKKNPEIFKSMLHAGRYINPDMGGDFIIGDPQAPVTLTIATSLTCGPCARAHTTIKEVLKKNNDVKIQYVFSVPRNGEPLDALKYIGAIYEQSGPVAAEKALDNWFEHKRLEELKKVFEVDMNRFDGESFTAQHKEIGNMFQITYTPTLFINGHLLPDIYQVGDIPFWLPYIRQYQYQLN